MIRDPIGSGVTGGKKGGGSVFVAFALQQVHQGALDYSVNAPAIALLGLMDEQQHSTEHVSSKFTAKVESVFSGLPKPKDKVSFATNDLPLLFTADEVQQFAMEHKLNKSQTKAVAELHKAAPEIFKEKEPAKVFERVIEKVVEASLPDYATDEERKEAVKAAKENSEGVRDLSANEIAKAAKKVKEHDSGRQKDIIAMKWTGDAEGYTPQTYIEFPCWR